MWRCEAVSFHAVLVLLLVRGARGAVLTAEPRGTPMVRRDEAARVHLGAAGEVMSAIERRRTPDFCNDAYELTEAGKSDCESTDVQARIESVLECQNAADAIGAARGEPFTVLEEDRDRYVWRCFQADNGTVYYNDAGQKPPASAAGKMLCKQPEFVVGKDNSNDCQESPPDFKAVLNETLCDNAAFCLSKGVPQFSRVFNRTDRPAGCYVDPDDTSMVLFNKIASTPGSPQGSPVCSNPGIALR